MLSEELIKKENWSHFSDDVLNLSVIKTTLGCWNGTFSKNATILLYVVNNGYRKVLHIKEKEKKKETNLCAREKVI